MNNDQCLYFICGGLGTNMMTTGWKWRLANIMTPFSKIIFPSCKKLRCKKGYVSLLMFC